MSEARGYRMGSLRFGRGQFVLAGIALIILVANIALLLWRRFGGESWADIWPSGLSALAMVLVIVSVLHRARTNA